MGRFSDRTKKVSNEEIEAVCDEFIAKMETLRIRYEQYFIGAEKKAPTALRMDVARLMRDLESAFVNNTALKFKIQTSIQKYTSYSTYWNRTLREIEDGTYKRHLDRVKRHKTDEPQPKYTAVESSGSKKQVASNPAVSQEVGDEAEAYLASLGISSGNRPPAGNRPPVSQPVAAQPQVKPQQIVRPAFIRSESTTTMPPAAPRPAVVQPATPRPAVVQPAAPRPAVVQPAAPRPAVVQPAAPRPAVVQPAAPRPAVVQPAAPRPAVVQPAAPRPAVVQPAAPRPAVVQPAAPRPAVVQPAAPRPAVVQPAAPRPAGVKPPLPPIKPKS